MQKYLWKYRVYKRIQAVYRCSSLPLILNDFNWTIPSHGYCERIRRHKSTAEPDRVVLRIADGNCCEKKRHFLTAFELSFWLQNPHVWLLTLFYQVVREQRRPGAYFRMSLPLVCGKTSDPLSPWNDGVHEGESIWSEKTWNTVWNKHLREENVVHILYVYVLICQCTYMVNHGKV